MTGSPVEFQTAYVRSTCTPDCWLGQHMKLVSIGRKKGHTQTYESYKKTVQFMIQSPTHVSNVVYEKKCCGFHSQLGRDVRSASGELACDSQRQKPTIIRLNVL